MLLEPGTWNVVVKDCRFVGEDDGGQAQLAIEFAWEENDEDRITWYTSLGTLKDGGFSEKALKFACDQIRNLGWSPEENGYAFERLAEEDSPIIGRACEIVVHNEVYEGKTRTRVKWINDPNRRPGRERMSPQAGASFCDRIRKAMGVSGVTRAPQPKPRPTAAIPRDLADDAEDLF